MTDKKSYFTYIVECIDGTFYTGMTYDVQRRVKQHNGILHGGAKYTKQRRPVALRYFEEYTLYKLAASRENQLKKLSHQKKEKLCSDFMLENSKILEVKRSL